MLSILGERVRFHFYIINEPVSVLCQRSLTYTYSIIMKKVVYACLSSIRNTYSVQIVAYGDAGVDTGQVYRMASYKTCISPLLCCSESDPVGCSWVVLIILHMTSEMVGQGTVALLSIARCRSTARRLYRRSSFCSTLSRARWLGARSRCKVWRLSKHSSLSSTETWLDRRGRNIVTCIDSFQLY